LRRSGGAKPPFYAPGGARRGFIGLGYTGRHTPGIGAPMSIVGILILIVCIWLFFKVVGGLFKAAIVVLAIAVIWYLVAPMLGMPRPF
jgi:hypothetical protein